MATTYPRAGICARNCAKEKNLRTRRTAFDAALWGKFCETFHSLSKKTEYPRNVPDVAG
jgi:hypothetical protein